MVPSFTPIHGVVVENSYTSDKTPARSGDVDASYRETFGQLLGIAYVVAPETARLSLGLTLFLPINQLAYFDSGESYQPEYFLYRSSTLRPQLDLGVGAEATAGLHFGAGLHVGFGQTVNGSLFLQSNTTQPSSFRIGASLKPKVSPYFGILATPSESLSLGAVLRLPLQTINDITLKSGFQLVGTLTGLDINFAGLSALYSDPLSIEMGTSWRYLDSTRLFLQADYQAWSKYQVPSISIQSPTTNDCQGSACGTGVRISPSRNPTFAFRDIVVPRVGHEWTVGRLSLRTGYAYRPSILKGIPTGPGNYLDPPKHHLNAGAGYRFDHFLHFEVPCSVDFHASYDLLVTQTIVKTPGNEAGDPTEAKIGSPGYEAGGKILGGGISLTLAF